MILYTRGRQSDLREIDGRLVDVFLDPQLRKCVFFVLANVSRHGLIEREIVGTGFFVCKSLYDSDAVEGAVYSRPPHAKYAVIARHVVKNYALGPLYIRVNTKESFIDIPTHPDDWVGHPGESTDVCVYDLSKHPINRPEGEREEMYCIPFYLLASDVYITENPITEGQDVFIVGLFIEYSGKKQSQPVLRFGNISLMPREKVDVFLSDEDKQEYRITEIDAYLVESRSMGGLSGAPVLFYYPPLDRQDESFMIHHQLPMILGLLHGQYDETESRLLRVINAGMSIVIPAGKIRETLMQESLARSRNEMLVESRRQDLINSRFKPSPASKDE